MEKDNVKWLSWCEKQFKKVTDDDGQIYLKDIKKVLNIKHSFFTKRFFQLFERDESGRISLSELLEALAVLLHGTTDDKLHFLFRCYGVEGNETIKVDEFYTVLKSCMAESAIQLSDEALRELTSVLFTEADENDTGLITFDELRNQLTKYPDITDNLILNAASWLSPPVKRLSAPSPECFSRKCIRNDFPLLIFVIIYFCINAALFWDANLRTRRTDPSYLWLSIAKGCGACLNFNGSLLLILMLKKFLTLLRSTRLAHYLPIDQHIYLHKAVACIVILLSSVHTVSHVMHFSFLTGKDNSYLSAGDYFFTIRSNIGWVKGTANITGILLITLLIFIALWSVSFVRRKGYFEVFYWTHQLCLLWWLLLILHAQKFWMWFVLPGAVYIIERVLRMKLVREAKFGKMYINQAVILPNKVLHLVIPRPSNFKFQAGEYIYINIPSIARHEWHPFTISSAPEQERFISVHIRSMGNWTEKLYNYFNVEQLNVENSHAERISNCCSQTTIRGSFPSVSMTNIEASNEVENTTKLERTIARNHVTIENEVTKSRSLKTSFQRNVIVGRSIVAKDDNETILKLNKSKLHAVHPIGTAFSGPAQHQYTDYNENELFDKRTGSENNQKVMKAKKSKLLRRHLTQHSLEVALDRSSSGTGVQVFVDGPYGAPSQHIFHAEHAVLIGAGIGVTPFASILQSIHERYKVAKRTCPSCKHAWVEETPPIMRLKKVDFIWINRDQKSFDWFISLLNQIEMEQQIIEPMNRFLNMHLYMTSALHKNDVKAIALQMALDLLHKRNNRDLITGLVTRTHPGRPDWNKVFTDIRNARQGKVTVFFCGSPELSEVIRKKSRKFGFDFRKENF